MAHPPRFDCGHLCLDFLTTDHPHEHLDTPDDLRAWITAAALVPGATPLDHITADWLTGFRELRGHIAQLVRVGPELRPHPFDVSLARVNELARAATPAVRAVRADDGTLTRALDRTPDRAALLALLARDTVELLTDPVACAGLRRCAGDNCPVVYVDTSRGRRRRWCSSEVCGNRERVARHRRRAGLARARA
ncbi:CGNR zinc finger domain-containing protein [Streptomyces griseiscabiei]|uniref:CGNR zinc finger domain-containing protein n=1 Tax=Streptomyces griseiscabiei TaxID=2993540 RepID=A0ABU4L0T4_9ACTN|nr:CGNR zinc finger domain-containing protein [Streptomyces griseiscabiei]MBZ3901116.1 CGNR zinc finger domain-containing protein [Streptomyces griseiscabiei]MDX2908753.1 CGNR zinc finger domain-containing protein [Streptomyces griseiscabiei]